MTAKPQGFIICRYQEGLQNPRIVAAQSIYDVYRSLLVSDWNAFVKDTMMTKIAKILSRRGPDYQLQPAERDYIATLSQYSNQEILVAMSDKNIQEVFEALFDNASSPERLSISVTPLNPMIPSIYDTFKPSKIDDRLSQTLKFAGL